MALQTKVPVRIPPSVDTTLAHRLDSRLPEGWLASPFDVPHVGHGIVIYGQDKGPFMGQKLAYVYASDSKVEIERLVCSDHNFDLLLYSLRQASYLPFYVRSRN